ncbi:hypothetical protein M758_7G181800 [Ceratodon purpureus]|nr:hypothetical protein M758_7G181800 [Ceratodon purpureus]
MPMPLKRLGSHSLALRCSLAFPCSLPLQSSLAVFPCSLALQPCVGVLPISSALPPSLHLSYHSIVMASLHAPLLLPPLFLSVLLLFLSNHSVHVHADTARATGTPDGTEEWGYIDVRPGAHMFWWLYYSEKVVTSSNLPLVLWLQGGPGASGVGYGNFQEVGPLTVDLKPRSSTWLNAAHLLFVDNPVGTGFSYVENSTLLTRNNKQATIDLVAFLGKFFGSHKSLKSTPFFVVAESYGGKFATELGVALEEKIDSGSLNINFKGVALGDTWISPIDFLYAWPPLLQSFSLVDEEGASSLLRYADSAQSEMENGNFLNATMIWGDMEEAVLKLADDVDFYNMLKHDKSEELSANVHGLARLAARHLSVTQSADLAEVMNGPIRQKLGIIPNKISWSESSNLVFGALSEDFMKDTIKQVLKKALRRTPLKKLFTSCTQVIKNCHPTIM